MHHFSQEFSINFSFPVHFTRSVFCDRNSAFLSIVRRLEPEKLHRIMFVVDSNVALANPHLAGEIRKYMNAFPSHLQMAGPPVVVEGGESCKNGMTAVLEMVEKLNASKMDRQSFVCVIGGGAVLDMVSFAAAIAHRGIRTIRIPTTVLGQADSGVGVKNGINLFGKKNFIGTFVPPFAVINDSEFIDTLQHRDKIAGAAEGIKVALLKDPAFFAFLEQNASGLANADPPVLQYLIRRSAELHLRHIRQSGDPFELGSSRPLDFGHWTAHKLESLTNHSLRHGECVAIGIALDVIYSMKKGWLPPASMERILTLLDRAGFNLWHDALRDSALFDGIQEFREHLGGMLHITLLRDIGDPFEVHELDENILLESIESLHDRSRISTTVE